MTDIDAIYRAESGRVLATLIRLLRSFELAEEATHEAFAAAALQWPRDGLPRNPFAWLVSAGRFKAIDRLRKKSRFDAVSEELARQIAAEAEDAMASEQHLIRDDRLRLIFICCHPMLPLDAQTALTLREVCGLTTEQIAHAFLSNPPTIAQRIVRAKSRIRDEHLPYEIPSRSELPERLDSVLRAIYLVFNQGYSEPAPGPVDLASEAIRLARLLVQLLPDPEAEGLLALLLLQDSRRAARVSPEGDQILLADQDRGLWNHAAIAEGIDLARRAMAAPSIGTYTLQAAIASVHAEAAAAAATDWPRIVALYDLLLRAEPSPVVELNRAVAIAMRDGPEAGLAAIDQLLLGGDLANYHLAHAARAGLLHRLGRLADSGDAYARALEVATTESERRFYSAKLHQAI